MMDRVIICSFITLYLVTGMLFQNVSHCKNWLTSRRGLVAVSLQTNPICTPDEIMLLILWFVFNIRNKMRERERERERKKTTFYFLYYNHIEGIQYLQETCKRYIFVCWAKLEGWGTQNIILEQPLLFKKKNPPKIMVAFCDQAQSMQSAFRG